MAKSKSKGGKRARRGNRKMNRRRAPKKLYGAGDFCRIRTVLNQEAALVCSANTASQVYYANNFSLTNSLRAVQVAQAFQEYRIAKVEMFVKPVADTYDANIIATAAAPGLPTFYYMIDKTSALMTSTTTTQTLKNAGAKPIRLDDKTIKVAFKPAVCIGSSDAGPGGTAPIEELAALHKVSPWITTNANAATPGALWVPNSVDHYGIVFGAEQTRGSTPTEVGVVSWAITYEFRKPLWFTNAAPGSAPVQLDLDEYVPPSKEAPPDVLG